MADNSKPLLQRFIPAFEWFALLDGPTVRADLWAGIAAGILILPQAIALATLANLPPEIGLYTAIFPVIVVAFLGSSWHSLSGPNTSISVVIAMILSGFASEGTADFVMYTITLTFMAGCIQFVFGLLRLGAIFNYFSHSVMVALVGGVGIIIIIQQIGGFLGLTVNGAEPIEDTIHSMFFSFPHSNWYAFGLGLVTIVTGFAVKYYRPGWPHIIIAVAAGMIGGAGMDLVVAPATSNIDKLGYLSLSALPLSAPDFSPTSFYEAAEALVMGSFMVAFLGLMQSAVIARSIAAKSGQHVNMNQEMTGQGISNIAGSFLSCYPSCGSFNRSAANYESGARTPLTGIISALVLAALVFFAAPVIAQLPLSVMAGVLFLVGWGLIDMPTIKKIVHVRGEARIMFIITFISTIYGGLQNGVFIGIFLSIVSYLRTVSRPELEVLFQEAATGYLPQGMAHEDATVIQLSGSVFFGSTPAIERSLSDIAEQDGRTGTLIIAGEYIDNIDQTGATTLINEVKKTTRARRWHGAMATQPFTG